MTRVSTIPAQPPAAWTTRPRIRPSIEVASPHRALRPGRRGAAQQCGPPTEAVGERAVGQGRKCDCEGGEAQGELGGGRATPNLSWIAGSAGMKICIAIGPSAVATIRTRSRRIETVPAGLAGLMRRCQALPMTSLVPRSQGRSHHAGRPGSSRPLREIDLGRQTNTTMRPQAQGSNRAGAADGGGAAEIGQGSFGLPTADRLRSGAYVVIRWVEVALRASAPQEDRPSHRKAGRPAARCMPAAVCRR